MTSVQLQQLSTTISDRDVFCIGCGYNLRGLSGDPIRCPECAHLNALQDIDISRESLALQLKYVEYGPNRCLVCAIIILLSGALIPVMPDLLPVSVLFIPIWIHSLKLVKAQCDHQPGWKTAMVQLHLYALFLFLALCSACAVLFIASSSVHPALFVGVLAGSLPPALWFRRKSKTNLQRLQRRFVVRMAGDQCVRNHGKATALPAGQTQDVP